jgi:hypothetical protein
VIRLRTLASIAAAVLIVAATGARTGAQQAADRLPRKVLDVAPPSDRVRGAPGEMTVQSRPCRALPPGETRRRVVDVAVQEWAFFGFRIVDRTDVDADPLLRTGVVDAGGPTNAGRRRPRLAPEEAARVASSIAGYWAVTPEGSWIVGRQNDEWKGPDGIGARWNAPWSAAFISWVMCEAGLGGPNQFQRAIAHHAYIDQAIRARDGRAAQAAFAAYDTGEMAITPGDMLCSSRRPVYRTVAERRRQMGVGARTHCDIVVAVEEESQRILAIGGNVRGIVGLKLLPAQRTAGKPLRVVDPDEDSRPIFVHLKLRADPIEADALDTSVAMKTLGCGVATRTAALRPSSNSAARRVIADRC